MDSRVFRLGYFEFSPIQRALRPQENNFYFPTDTILYEERKFGKKKKKTRNILSVK